MLGSYLLLLSFSFEGPSFSSSLLLLQRMYNLRARARAALSGSVRTQGMWVRGSPNWTNQVTSTQALEILETESEIVPDTEILVSEVSDVSITQANDRNTLKSEAATQSPIHTQSAYSDFT